MLDEKAIETLQMKSSKIVSAFLKKKYPNAEVTQKNIPLIRAIFIPCLYNENPGVVKVVLDYFKLDPNMELRENNLKPIHLAGASGSFEAISDLLNAGADPESRVTLENQTTATFMNILDAKVHTKTAEKSAQLLKQLQAQKSSPNVKRKDLESTEEESSANTKSFSASAPLLRKRK